MQYARSNMHNLEEHYKVAAQVPQHAVLVSWQTQVDLSNDLGRMETMVVHVTERLLLSQQQHGSNKPDLVNLSLPRQKDENVPLGVMKVDVHCCVNRSSKVIQRVVLLAVDDLHIKGAPRHIEDWAVIEVGAELLAIQSG